MKHRDARSRRGFRRDRIATSICREAGRSLRDDGGEPYLYLTDSRSFLSEPKIIKGECETPEYHIIAFGEVDKGLIRAEIFRRNREKNGGRNRCMKCGRRVRENLGEAWYDVQIIGEWHHVRHKAGERCDCPENGEVICGGPFGCHRNEHLQPRWTAPTGSGAGVRA